MNYRTEQNYLVDGRFLSNVFTFLISNTFPSNVLVATITFVLMRYVHKGLVSEILHKLIQSYMLFCGGIALYIFSI